MNQEELFKNLKILEEFYNKEFVDLQQYYEIKSNIIDNFLEKKEGE